MKYMKGSQPMDVACGTEEVLMEKRGASKNVERRTVGGSDASADAARPNEEP